MNEGGDDSIDSMIFMLQGLRNKNKALAILGMVYSNSLFEENQFNDHRQKCLDHIRGSILKAMQILMGKKE